MEQNLFLLLGIPLLAALFGFMAKWMLRKAESDILSLTQSISELTKELTQVKVEYAHKSDLLAVRNEIMARFDRLEDRLDAIKK